MKAKTNKNQFKGLRVVVVDNNDDSLKMISLYLKWLGANIKAVTSAKNAINTIKSFQPELIISDLFMPEEDGYWLIKTIREEHNKYIPAIALTIASTNEDKKKSLSFGYDAHLAKPFLFEDLNSLINKLISH